MDRFAVIESYSSLRTGTRGAARPPGMAMFRQFRFLLEDHGPRKSTSGAGLITRHGAMAHEAIIAVSRSFRNEVKARESERPQTAVCEFPDVHFMV